MPIVQFDFVLLRIHVFFSTVEGFIVVELIDGSIDAVVRTEGGCHRRRRAKMLLPRS